MIIHVKTTSKRTKKASQKKRTDKAMTEAVNQKWAFDSSAKLAKANVYRLTLPDTRIPDNVKSHGPTIGDTSKVESKTYTGENMVGIATLHKSNAVPVFSQQEAEDVTNMNQ